MTFPVWISFGPWRVHPHLVFELLAYLVAGVAYWLPSAQKVTTAVLVDYDVLDQRNYAPARAKDTRYGVKALISF